MKKEEQEWREKQISFLEGREYERRIDNKKSVKVSVSKIGRELLKQFPEDKMPIDGAGDEDSYNNGYNDALKEVGNLIINLFSTL